MFQRAAESFFLTDLEQLHVRQHEVAQPLIEIISDRISSAKQTDIQRVVCTVHVVVEFHIFKILPVVSTTTGHQC